MRKARPGCFPADDVQRYCANDSCVASFPAGAGIRQHKRRCDNAGARGGARPPSDESPEKISCAARPMASSSDAQYLVHRRLHRKYGHVEYLIATADS